MALGDLQNNHRWSAPIKQQHLNSFEFVFAFYVGSRFKISVDFWFPNSVGCQKSERLNKWNKNVFIRISHTQAIQQSPDVHDEITSFGARVSRYGCSRTHSPVCRNIPSAPNVNNTEHFHPRPANNGYEWMRKIECMLNDSYLCIYLVPSKYFVCKTHRSLRWSQINKSGLWWGTKKKEWKKWNYVSGSR